MHKGSIIVVSGPSGAGKGTVISRLLTQCRDIFFSVSVTTRGMRPGEVEGVHYHFISEREYDEILSADAFLETAEVHGCHYGTPAVPVLNAVGNGHDALLDIDVQGASQVMARCPEAVTVFLMPPSLQELEKRLRGRNTETEEKVLKRLSNARREVLEASRYQYVIVNDQLDDAVAQLKAVILASRHRTQTNRDQLNQIISTFQA